MHTRRIITLWMRMHCSRAGSSRIMAVLGGLLLFLLLGLVGKTFSEKVVSRGKCDIKAVCFAIGVVAALLGCRQV